MFDWLGKGTSIDQLIARGQYQRAIKLIRAELDDGPKSVRLLQKLAEVLILAGKTKQAVEIYHHLVEEFADSGFFAKAIAVAKKIQRIDPDNVAAAAQLASLIDTRDSERAAALDFKKRSLKPIISTQSDDEDDDESIEIVIECEIDAPPEEDTGEASVFQGTPLFQDMTPGEVLALVEGLHLRTFEPGEIIVTEGEPGDSMFLLAGGVVRVFVRNAEGSNREVRSIDQGDFFGEISLVTGSRRTATITAATTCDLLELRSEDLASIAIEYPHISSVIEAFCQRRSGSKEEVEARNAPGGGGC